MEFFHKATHFPFMRTRKVWYGLSAVLIVVSLALSFGTPKNLGPMTDTGLRVKQQVNAHMNEAPPAAH